MIIIGEKINGAIPSVKDAISRHDEESIKNLAVAQEKAGANYIDVCAGTEPEIEYETMCWLIDLVQSVAETPLCIDSPDPELLVKLFPRVKKPGLINSISLEGRKCEILLPLLRENPEWGVVALCCDQSGIAESADVKVANAFTLIANAAEYCVTPDRIHIDPLVLAVSAVMDSGMQFLEAIRRIKEKYPTVHVTAALSNISYGMPARKLVNTAFLTLAMEAGLDSVIADPLNRDVLGALYATDVLLNRDRLCRNYNKAFRKGLIGTPKK